MGYTGKTIELINEIITRYKPKTVCDLGSQNNYAQPLLPAPYMSTWWMDQGIDEYMSIDLNGENDSKKWDLSEPLKTTKKLDLVVDAGTSEHVKDYYQCLANIDKLAKVGAIIVHENPMTGHWPGHCFHYIDTDFYRKFSEVSGYELLKLEVHYAMHNYESGGNVIAVMRKTKEEFITREQMPETYGA